MMRALGGGFMRSFALLIVLLAPLAGCDNGGGGTDSGPQVDSGPVDSGPPDTGMVMVACDDPIPSLEAVSISGGDTFSSPVFVAQPPGSTDLYVVERGGRVRIVRAGAIVPTPFLDISGDLGGTPGGGAEWGLLSIAFHPQYAANGRFFIGWTPSGGNNLVSEGTRSAADPDVADPTLTDILAVNDFASNHNGGLVMFGSDGMLYVGMGDGGGANDPMRTSQDMNEMLGKILRIDVSTPGAYTVPPTNPFVGMAGTRGEIWSYGLRNPWRFSFDRMTGDLWIGDVGQDNWEEVDFAAAAGGNLGGRGDNYGWSDFEGTNNFAGDTLGGPSPHTPPITEYDHGAGASIVGGYVYRGGAIPALTGVYLFGDSYSGFVRGLRQCGGSVTLGPSNIAGLDTGATGGAGLVSFGEDNAGELYLVYLTGQVMRIQAM
jgi:glucose/arabinose dehydrogenase